jgi:hypothetical protein
MDPVAALTGFVGVASLVPAFMASRHEMPLYRPWYGRAFVMLLGGLACALLSLFPWSASDVLFWLGVLLVTTGALITWSLRFRTWRRLHPRDRTSQAG